MSMAISHAHLILLVFLPLFFLPTLQAIPFKDCGDGSSYVEVTSVDITNDNDGARFQISGSTSKYISNGSMRVKVRLGVIIIFAQEYDLCRYVACPVAPGAFVLPFDKVFPSFPRLKAKFNINISDEHDDEIICLNFQLKNEHSVVVSD